VADARPVKTVLGKDRFGGIQDGPTRPFGIMVTTANRFDFRHNYFSLINRLINYLTD
jgi:hypothetical protein